MKTIAKLAVSSIKKNRSQSILIIISIMLTTMLLSMIGTLGYGTAKLNSKNAGAMYGSYYGAYTKVTDEQIQKIERHSEFESIGKRASFGEAEGSGAKISMAWLDDTGASMTNYTSALKQGSMPKQKNEIAGPTELFEKLGCQNPKVGDKVTVSYRTDHDSRMQPQEFVISGIAAASEFDNLQSAYQAYISQELYESTSLAEQRMYTVYVQLSDSVSVNAENGEAVLKDLGKECGIEPGNVSANTIYLMWAFDPGTETIMMCVGIAVLVMVVSIVVIYNIFQVGIVQKVQEYGKLKALGATKKQLKKVIFLEGMFLAIIGIPLGLLSGTLAGTVIFKVFIEKGLNARTMGTWESVSAISLPVLLLVAVAAVLTVWLALKKPMRIVASISPMEAVRYQESSKSKRGIRQGKKQMSIPAMTFANFAGNRKRTITTIVTMGLSCVMFVTLANLAGNIDNDFEVRKELEHGQFLIELDYRLNDEAYPEKNLSNIQKNNPIGSELQEQVKGIKGVTEVQTRNFFTVSGGNVSQEGKEVLDSVSVLNREDFESYTSQGSSIGTLDYDQVTEKNGIIYGFSYWLGEDGYALNQEVELNILSGDNTIPYSTEIMGAFGFAESTWIITEDSFKKLGLTEELTGQLWIDCQKKDVAAVETALNKLMEGTANVQIETYENSYKTVKLSTQMMQGGIYGLIGIIGIVGFLNMANTVITGVITRKRELGVLQAVGMTNSQLNKMLQLEGVIFSMGTILVSLILGSPLGYALFLYAKEKTVYGLNTYHFPILEIGIMVGAIIVLQATLSFLLSRNLRKDSLVERINYQE